MTDLTAHIKNQIGQHGPMDVGTFMGLAVSHYYASRDPLGRGGDFTTAPEISQMFGEMLGVWVADTWHKLGRPKPFVLLECGPGRGTLMADVLRTLCAVPDCLSAARVVLMENSLALRQKQKEALTGYEVQWIETLDELEADKPLILLANEFLDALPVRQAQFDGEVWRERVVGLEADQPVFGLGAPVTTPPPFPCREGNIFEFSPVRESFVRNVGDFLKEPGGAALFIDYGHDRSGVGDTLQAVKDHGYCDVLDQIGEADMTSHVDFGALARVAGVDVRGPVGQGAFLERLGMAERANSLMAAGGLPERQVEIRTAYDRLCAPDHMGELFRVMALCHDADVELAGF
ncbi:MAG: SAM-dependent methyltransferase [Rhodospirillales bacterium]|nr:SAM-dependent methyltransferase [Rhodospirillales bacterium]